MAIGDLPQMATASHTHQVYGLGDFVGANFTTTGINPNLTGTVINPYFGGALGQAVSDPIACLYDAGRPVPRRKSEQFEHTEPFMPQRRFVRVLIADTNESVPLDKSILWAGAEQFTDLTDQELFFELGIKAMLDGHNAERIKIVDKTVKERTEYLEPAKVRDLKMVVVTVAQF